MTKAQPTTYEQRGLTLIQVMAILGLLGIILASATSAYLKHQNTYQVQEAFDQAQFAREAVNKSFQTNSSQTPQTQVDWSSGFSEHFSDDGVWSVKIDSSSATVIVKVLVDSTPSTLLLIPLKNIHSKAQDPDELKKEEALNKSPNEGLIWVCVTKDSEIPDLSMALGNWSAQMPKPELSEQYRPIGCR